MSRIPEYLTLQKKSGKMSVRSGTAKEGELIQPKRPPLISGTQFVAIVIVTVAIFFIVDFGQRATAGYYVSQAEKTLKAQIHAELTRRAELEVTREYVASEEYVERWARETHMKRVGDQPLIIVTPRAEQRRQGEALPASTPTPSTSDATWVEWWRLFFDFDPLNLAPE